MCLDHTNVDPLLHEWNTWVAGLYLLSGISGLDYWTGILD